MSKIREHELQKEESKKQPAIKFQYGFYLGGEKDCIAWVWATSNKQAMYFYKNKMFIHLIQQYINPNRSDVYIEARKILNS